MIFSFKLNVCDKQVQSGINVRLKKYHLRKYIAIYTFKTKICIHFFVLFSNSFLKAV